MFEIFTYIYVYDVFNGKWQVNKSHMEHMGNVQSQMSFKIFHIESLPLRPGHGNLRP